MRPSVRFLAATVLLAGSLAAQQNVLYVGNPVAGTGGGNAFPWGSNGIRYQTIVPSMQLPPVLVINDIFVAGAPSGTDLDIDYTDIEILIGRTAQVAPVADWNTNNPNPVRVYRGPLRVYFERAAWRGLGLPNAHVFVPTPAEPNMCLEIIVWGTTTGTGNFYFPETDTGVNRAFRFQWTTNQTQTPLTSGGGSKFGLLLQDGNFVEVGGGCPGSNGTPRIGASTYPIGGQTMDLTLSGARPASPAFLSIGASFTSFGTIPLPLDLGVLGAPSCFVWNDSIVTLQTSTNATGNASITLPIPVGTAFTRLYATWFNVDIPANSFGLTTSSGGKLLLSN